MRVLITCLIGPCFTEVLCTRSLNVHCRLHALMKLICEEANEELIERVLHITIPLPSFGTSCSIVHVSAL